MRPDSQSKRNLLASQTAARAAVVLSFHELQNTSPHSTPSMPAALLAFADGFCSSLVGGLLYCLILALYYPSGLSLAWLRVVALCVACGGFEMWRVTSKRTLRSMKAGAFWALTASLVVWWALGAFAPTQ